MISRFAFFSTVAFFCFLVGVAPYASADEKKFVSGFADVPLAPGLKNKPKSLSSFDTPEGRIVESHVKLRGEAAPIFAFYEATLPALGWKKLKNTDNTRQFTREKEILSIEYVKKRDMRFLLSPKKK